MTIQELFQIGMDRSIGEILPIPEGLVLNVGAGNKAIPGSVPLDFPEWDCDHDPIPYGNESVSGIHCYHFLEHTQHPIAVIQEFNRVLRVGGVANIVVPFITLPCRHKTSITKPDSVRILGRHSSIIHTTRSSRWIGDWRSTLTLSSELLNVTSA